MPWLTALCSLQTMVGRRPKWAGYFKQNKAQIMKGINGIWGYRTIRPVEATTAVSLPILNRHCPPQSACQKIFVTDGAAWIGQWIAQQYKGAVHILDFFHVCEKLAPLAPKGDVKWLARQKESLLKDGVEAVIAEVTKLRPMHENVDQVLVYLENHKHQMDYRYYRQQGWMIGSGAIESAHRTLLQVRMKRSGQRWADHGCDNMIKLRITIKNGKRELIQNLLKRAA